MPGIGNGAAVGEKVNLDKVFFSLVIIQGLFTGLMICKFSEGKLKNGLMHSLILITLATLIISIAKGGI